MAPIVGAASLQAYRREASRLSTVVPKVAGKVVTRSAGISIGPLTVSFTSSDYEFDLSGASLDAAVAEALDATAATPSLDTEALAAPAPNAVTVRQAQAGYRNAQEQADGSRPSMFTAKV